MDLEGPAHRWANRVRFAAAAASGFVWAALWFGLASLDAPPVWFWMATFLFVAPILAFLTRTWLDLLVLVAAAFGASLVVAAILVASTEPGVFASIEGGVDFLEQTSLAWAVAAAEAAALYALVAPLRTGRRPTAS